jgi:eukaryotic-like serine/threonine-protein kinase
MVAALSTGRKKRIERVHTIVTHSSRNAGGIVLPLSFDFCSRGGAGATRPMSGNQGRTLGKYKLVAEIARGGMGIVYLAMAQGPGGFHKLVVVKELKPDLVEDPAFLAMFLDEARLAARLNHPNIVQTNEVGNDGNRYFMAMDYLDGRTLDRIRRRSAAAGAPFTTHMQLKVLCELLSGLEYAHKLADFDGTPLGIVHRDVSPQNVFVTFEGQVKIVDFGIAKAADSTQETRAGVLKGKISYMAPEQARGQKVDARADVFSAGMMLWETLTGKRMWQGTSDLDILRALVASDLPRASTVNPNVPTELDDICAKAMSFDRDKRHASAGALQDDIELYLLGVGKAVSTREIGACVTELFRDDRVKTNAVIEAHVARARAGAARDELPSIDVALHAAVSGSTPVDNPNTSSLPIPAPPSVPGLGTHPMSVSAGAVVHTSASPPEKRRSGMMLLLPGLGIGAAACGVVFALMRGAHPAAPVSAAAPADDVAPAQPASAAVPLVAPGPELVDVEIRVSPANAAITVDGATVSGNPFHGKYPRGEAMHRIRAVAGGYLPKSTDVPFSANVTLDLSLEHVQPIHVIVPAPPPRPAPVARGNPPRPADTPTPAPAPTDVSPQGGSKPRRPIDPSNPYGTE